MSAVSINSKSSEVDRAINVVVEDRARRRSAIYIFRLRRRSEVCSDNSSSSSLIAPLLEIHCIRASFVTFHACRICTRSNNYRRQRSAVLSVGSLGETVETRTVVLVNNDTTPRDSYLPKVKKVRIDAKIFVFRRKADYIRD